MSKRKTLLKSTPVSRDHFSSGRSKSPAAAAVQALTRCVVRVIEGKQLLASDALTGKSDPVCFLWIGSPFIAQLLFLLYHIIFFLFFLFSAVHRSEGRVSCMGPRRCPRSETRWRNTDYCRMPYHLRSNLAIRPHVCVKSPQCAFADDVSSGSTCEGRGCRWNQRSGIVRLIRVHWDQL